MELETNGILVGVNKVHKKFRINVITADAPARAFVAGTRYFNHMHGCTKCDQVCSSEGKRRIYSTTVGTLRTDASFESRDDPLHHDPKYVHKIGTGPAATFFPNRSVLELSGHHLVSQIPLDPMHLLDNGIGKLILSSLMSREMFGGPTEFALNKLQIEFQRYHRYVLAEYQRRTKSLVRVKQFKGTENRQFLLEWGVVLFKDYLSHDLYTHFLKLSISYRILLSHENVDFILAEKLLSEFVRDFCLFYPKEYVRYKVHSLLHLVEDSKLHGPLDTFSAYKFENRIGQLKKIVKSNNLVLEQIFNRVNERRAFGVKSVSRKVQIRDNKIRNSCVVLRDGSVGEITCCVEGGYMCKIYNNRSSFFTEPVLSESVGIFLVSDLSTTEVYLTSSQIHQKCYRLPYHNYFVAIKLSLAVLSSCMS